MDILRERRAVSLDADQRPADPVDVGAEVPGARLDRELMGERVREAVAGLPAEQREVLSLRVYGGMAFREIAKVMRCPLNTALGRMRYALLNLKKALEGAVVEE